VKVGKKLDIFISDFIKSRSYIMNNVRKIFLERFYSSETYPIYTATNMNGYNFTEEVHCRIYPECSLLLFSDYLSWTQTTPMPRSNKSKDNKC